MTSWHRFQSRRVLLAIVLGAGSSIAGPAVFSQDLAGLLEEAEKVEPSQPGPKNANETGRNRPPAGPVRVPVPSQAEQRTSAAKVREIYGKEAASAATPALKTRLARTLLEQSAADGNPSDKYALLEVASRLAIEAGDPPLLRECRASMARHFAVDVSTMRGVDLEALAAKAPVETLAVVVPFILEATEADAAAGRFEAAEDAVKVAATAARRARNASLTKSVNGRLVELRGLRKQEADLKPLLDRLAADPGDRDTAKQVGMIRCFNQSRWAEGIPLLAKGDDPDLAAAAALELRPGKTGAVAAADAWWTYAETKKGPVKDAARRHAADLYQQMLPDLSGLDKVRVEKRVQEAAIGTEGGEKPIYLADLKEAAINGAKYGFSKDGTYLGKAFKCVEQTWPKALAPMPDGNSSASVEYQLATSPSRIQGRVGVFTPADAKPEQQPGSPLVFEVVADGQVVWRSQPMTKREAVQAFRTELKGATLLELRTICTGTGYCAWGAWLDVHVVK